MFTNLVGGGGLSGAHATCTLVATSALSIARNCASAFRILRIPIVVSLAVICTFSLPDQIRDVYRVYASNSGANAFGILMLALGLSFLSAGIVLASHAALLLYLQTGAGKAKPLYRYILATVVILSITPWIGCALGLVLALPKRVIVPQLLSEDQRQYGFPEGGLYILIILTFLTSLGIAGFLIRKARPFHALRQNFGARLQRRIAAYGATALICLLPFLSPDLPQFLGPLFWAAAFFACLLFILISLASASERLRLPLTKIIIIGAVLWAAFNTNDNHHIRYSETHEVAKSLAQRDLGVSFLRWLDSRQDFDHYVTSKKPYPIYVVAARGGGIYAAYHSAITLARIQDRCPRFAQHVFAISAVSGGSFGAAVFSKLAEKFSKNDKFAPCHSDSDYDHKFERLAKSVLSHDFLSPLLWRALFPDFFQRFFPIAIPPFDRARGLEYSFERAWDFALPEYKGSFSDPYFRTWDPGGSAPAFLANTTEIRSGGRVVFSPFEFYFLDDVLQTYQWRSGLEMDGKSHDIPLSVVVGVSARFPWITPPATISGFKLRNAGGGYVEQTFRLADGGYFEASAIETAMDVANAIRLFLDPANIPERERESYRGVLENYESETGKVFVMPPVRFVVKLITFTDSDYSLWQAEENRAFSEVIAPLEALMATRTQRGALASARSIDVNNCPSCYTPNLSLHEVRTFQLSVTDYPVPLGWLLSDTAREYIDKQIGNFSGCAVSPPGAEGGSGAGFKSMYERAISANSCDSYLVTVDLGS